MIWICWCGKYTLVQQKQQQTSQLYILRELWTYGETLWDCSGELLSLGDGSARSFDLLILRSVPSQTLFRFPELE